MSNIVINIKQAKDLVIRAMKAKLTPMISGSPGLGKSALIHAIADEFGLKVIDFRLSQCDPTDMSGFPCVSGNKASYKPMDTFPLESDPIPEGYNGWLLFMDEMNHGSQATQKAAYKIILDRMIGQEKLHSKLAIVCAGNLDTDNAMVEQMSTALQSRMVHLEISVDPDVWVDWAMENDIDHRITSYIKFAPNKLYTFSPDHSDKTYACPRTWEFTSRMISEEAQIEFALLPLLAGSISEGVAREFISFTKVYKDLLTMAEIKAAPKTVRVPTEPSVLYALTGMLGHNADKDNIKILMDFISRLPIEFQIICMREIVKRDPAVIKTTTFTEWSVKNATELF